MTHILKNHRETWQKKKILRDIYSEWYSWIISDLSKSEGKTLELGAGSGNFKEFYPEAISADIEKCDWLDMCFDAHEMPFGKDEVSNIVMIDVLHHLADPIKFFHEAYRVLQPAGRILMIEPYPSLFSGIVYKLFHPEPFIMDVDYFNLNKAKKNKDPWDSNQAIPYLLFFKHLNKWEQEFKAKFKLSKRQRFSFLLYPLSGGFENRQLIPDFSIPMFKMLEKVLTPLNYFIAFRCYVVLEKLDNR